MTKSVTDRAADALLTAEEVCRLAGGYKRPSDQLRELQRLGFYRARLGRVSRQVIVERAHYDAVCSGSTGPANEAAYRPQVRPPRTRTR